MALYSVVALAAVGLFLASVILFAVGRLGWIVFVLTLAIDGLLIYVVPLRLLPWTRVRVTYRLEGNTLSIYKSYEGKKDLRGYPKHHKLKHLWAAQEIGQTQKLLDNSHGTVGFVPPKLILILETESGGEEQVRLSRPSVSGSKSREALIERELDPWKEICALIQMEALPRALARRWPDASSYQRYCLVVLQAEIEFLQGKRTALQMCLATVRSIFNVLWEAFKILGAGLLVFVGAGFVLMVIFIVLGGLGFRGGIKAWTLAMWLLPFFLVSVAYGVLMLFRPLSTQLQRDSGNRMSQARRLIETGLTRYDLDLIVTFLKDEIEHVRHTLTTLTVATALPVLFTLLPKFFPGASSWISNGALAVSIAAFAVVQLYYYSQIRILHLAQTNCLIARGELGKEVP